MKKQRFSAFLSTVLIALFLFNTTTQAKSYESNLYDEVMPSFSEVIGSTIESVSYISKNHFLKSIVSRDFIKVAEYKDGEMVSFDSIPNTSIDVSYHIQSERFTGHVSSPVLMATSYGTVTYNRESGKPIHRLQISADTRTSKRGTFTYNKSGKSLAQYTSFLMSALGLWFPPAGLAAAAFGAVAANASVTISGTMTGYKTYAKDPATNRTKSYDGCKYEGRVEGRYTVKYEQYYPQFISRKDTVVAGWLHNHFWGNYNTPAW